MGAGTAAAPATLHIPAKRLPWPLLLARTLQADVIGILTVIKQGCVIPKEFGISPTFVTPHGAHLGG